ncbi:hypothetical protein BBF96_09050 [Anoxybacter fermentans]|uniref:Farnesyl diphosphate synthase n=1 Tax=Anoxybacter fermentans TaxID=1323375 RepID=A0A3Q9HR61_9FIRM|nr:farnesyl diphosphate synthase [Anoxybacter fermentans]AZR73519.1 hypothetical protein BBF96_09050 [Anoxybacter fermentans]
MSFTDFKAALKATADEVNQALKEYLPQGKPEILHESMAYSVYAGGKRLRPVLTLWTAELLGGDKKHVMPIACALELIHTYSLIHDDLPCMDDDDLRRGKPTNHVVYGEAIALLAGDALLTRAFEVMAKAVENGADSHRLLKVIGEIGEAAGSKGMVGGQVVDILSEGKKIDLETLKYIHAHKTGALFRASIRSGAIMSGASSEDLARLTEFAEYLGLAFQITDDILDVVGDETKLGKPVGSDESHAKATYPALVGLEEARRLAQESVNRAKEALAPYKEKAERFNQLLDFILTRES